MVAASVNDKEKVNESDLYNMLSVVIPAYNEESGIADIVERVLKVRPALTDIGIGLELIVVDDGSSDRTAAIVRDGYPEVRIVQHNPNRGYGAALKTGFHFAKGGLLGFLDADGTYPPESFPELCLEIKKGADVVVGSRRSGAASDMPFVRRVGNFVWSNLVTLLTHHRVMDPASGMRVFRREALLVLYPLPDGLNFTPVMSTRTVHEGLKLAEIPMPYMEREGSSKLSVLEDGIRFLRTILWTSMYYNPARILGGIGFGLFVIGTLIALALIGTRLSGVTTLGPLGVTSVYAALVFCVSGFDLFALGATFNYLVALYHKDVVQTGLFGKPIFDPPLDQHFWWMGLLAILAGLGLCGLSLGLGLTGWPIDRLWLYLLAGTMLLLLGTQLIIFWIVMRVLDELSQRELLIRTDFEDAKQYECN